MSQTQRLVIAHLSDLHIKSSSSVGSVRLTQVAGSIGSMWQPETELLILLSGDVAFSCKADEYAAVSEALKILLSKLADWEFTKISIVAVPGNHDCDLLSGLPVIRESLLSGMAKADDNGVIGIVGELRKAQKEFDLFAISNCAPLSPISDVVSKFEIALGDKKVVLLLINSAWSSRLHEQPGQLRMPSAILPAASVDADFSIAVAHHPLNWYLPEDAKIFSEWLDRNSDFALWGHEHREDDALVLRKRYGSSVRYLLGLPVEDGAAKCGFRCIVVDSNLSQVEIQSFQWNGDKIDRLLKDVEPFASNPARSIGKIRFSPSFRRFLDDVGGAFEHPRIDRALNLSDVYVPPEFKSYESSRREADLLDGSIRAELLYDKLFSCQKTIIFGPELSGKTCFAKSVIGEVRHRGVTPIYFDVSALRSANRGEITAWINSSLLAQFEADCIEDVRCLPPDQKIVIVDGLEQAPGGDAGAAIVLERLMELGRRTLLLTTQAPALAVLSASLLGRDDDGSYWKDAHWYELLPLGHKRRGELLRRWASLGRDQVVDGELIEAEVRQVKALLDRSLGKNFIPKYPFFLLVILQQVETYKENKTVVTNGSHGHLFEALIVQAIDRHVTAHPINTVHDFLSHAAFSLWSRDSNEISSSGLMEICEDIRRDKLIALNMKDLMAQLDSAKILRVESEGVGFRYPYLYYYYLARWMGANRRHDSARNLMNHVVDFIHTERSSNVVMFLAHLGHEQWVLEHILPLAKSLFVEQPEVRLESKSSLAAKFSDPQSRQVLFLGDPAKVSDHHHERADASNSFRSSNENGLENIEEDAFRLNAAFRVIQVLGNIVKSRAGDVPASQKVEIAEDAIRLARRFMSFMYGVIEEGSEEIVRFASDAFERKLRVDREAAVLVARGVIGAIVSGLAKVIVSRTTDSFSTAELIPLIDEIESRAQGDKDVQLFAVMARIAVSPTYPREKVDDYLASLKKYDVLTNRTIAWAVSRQFYLQPPPHSVRDSVCKKLGIEMKILPAPGLSGRKSHS